jgi:hypothetical protein
MLHAAAVAHQSKALAVLVNGQMKEAHDDCAVWEDTDEQTFVRFSQFVYTGNYDGASPHVIDSSPNQPNTLENGGQPARILATPKKNTAVVPQFGFKQPSRKDKLWAIFKEHQYLESVADILPMQNKENEDYTEVFLSHARVFVFADYHGISALEALALHKLQTALVAFQIYEARTGDISHLIGYCYENTIQLTKLCGLRGLLATYAACNIEILHRSTEFQALLETRGDFAKDFVTSILNRLD